MGHLAGPDLGREPSVELRGTLANPAVEGYGIRQRRCGIVRPECPAGCLCDVERQEPHLGVCPSQEDAHDGEKQHDERERNPDRRQDQATMTM